jgi:hypothetical protein
MLAGSMNAPYWTFDALFCSYGKRIVDNVSGLRPTASAGACFEAQDRRQLGRRSLGDLMESVSLGGWGSILRGGMNSGLSKWRRSGLFGWRYCNTSHAIA